MDNLKSGSSHPYSRGLPEDELSHQVSLLRNEVKKLRIKEIKHYNQFNQITLETIQSSGIPELVRNITDLAGRVSVTPTVESSVTSSAPSITPTVENNATPTPIAASTLRSSLFRPVTPRPQGATTPLEKVQNIIKKTIGSQEDLQTVYQELEKLQDDLFSASETPPDLRGEKEMLRSSVGGFFPFNITNIGFKRKFTKKYEEDPDPENMMGSFRSYYKTKPFWCFKLNMEGEDVEFHGGDVNEKNPNLSPGCGATSRVFFGTNSKGEKLALKVSSPTSEVAGDFGAYNKSAQEREAEMLLQIGDNQYVAGALAVGFIDELMFVVMRQAEGKELYERAVEEDRFIQSISSSKISPPTIEERNKFYPISKKIEHLIEVARGMEFLHSLGIVHRDLKMENIMVGSNAKIIDLGFASYVRDKVRVCSGTPVCMSPETILREEQGTASDIYSFGLLMDSLLSGRLYLTLEDKSRKLQQAKEEGRPFEERQLLPLQVEGDIRPKPERYDYFLGEWDNDELKEAIAQLVAGCLKKSPGDRIGINEIITRMEYLKEGIKKAGF